MKKGSNKNTTIDDLAVMVARGFDRVDKKFDKVDKRFDEVGKRFEKIEEEIKAARRDILDIGDRFVPRYEFDNLLVRFNKLEKKFKQQVE